MAPYLFRLPLFVTMDLATSRTHLMKRPTTGLRVRFFNVKTATGQGRIVTLTASSFNACRSSPWCSTDCQQAKLAKGAKDKACRPAA